MVKKMMVKEIFEKVWDDEVQRAKLGSTSDIITNLVCPYCDGEVEIVDIVKYAGYIAVYYVCTQHEFSACEDGVFEDTLYPL
jgi:uncharacterized protein with PIN domain